MAKIKSLSTDGVDFASDHYNLNREEFVNKATQEFGPYSVEFSCALKEYDDIQREIYSICGETYG